MPDCRPARAVAFGSRCGCGGPAVPAGARNWLQSLMGKALIAIFLNRSLWVMALTQRINLAWPLARQLVLSGVGAVGVRMYQSLCGGAECAIFLQYHNRSAPVRTGQCYCAVWCNPFLAGAQRQPSWRAARCACCFVSVKKETSCKCISRASAP